MSLPAMNSQPTLFGSVPSVAGALFSEDDRYRLFARKVWPVLAGTRAALEKCYCPDNGRPATRTGKLTVCRLHDVDGHGPPLQVRTRLAPTPRAIVVLYVTHV
jgi:hypothetical protein